MALKEAGACLTELVGRADELPPALAASLAELLFTRLPPALTAASEAAALRELLHAATSLLFASSPARPDDRQPRSFNLLYLQALAEGLGGELLAGRLCPLSAATVVAGLEGLAAAVRGLEPPRTSGGCMPAWASRPGPAGWRCCTGAIIDRFQSTHCAIL